MPTEASVRTLTLRLQENAKALMVAHLSLGDDALRQQSLPLCDYEASDLLEAPAIMTQRR